MVIEITRREVLNNLIRFKDSLLERKEKQQREKKRTYNVLINTKTGDMRFAKRIAALEHHLIRERKGSMEDWKEIHLIVEQSKGEVRFEALDSQDLPLKASDLKPLAWKIASETVKVLNLKSQEEHPNSLEVLPEEALLQDLSSIHLSSDQDRIEHLPGWADNVNRYQAERLLWDSLPGSFLIREADPLTKQTAFHLSESNGFSIQPYLITFVEKESKISDLIILQTAYGWTLYQDDPDLSNSAYRYASTVDEFFQTLHHRLKHPIKIRH